MYKRNDYLKPLGLPHRGRDAALHPQSKSKVGATQELPFHLLLHRGVGDGATPFPGLFHFTLDPNVFEYLV